MMPDGVHAEESASLLHEDEPFTSVRVPCAGQRHITGIASRYSNEYQPLLQNIVSPSEFSDIIDRLNETIMDYWPCGPCYYFGYLCCPCSFGLSVLLPNYCASYSELYATAYLRNVSLRAKFFDRHISFTLVKSFCDSHIEVKFPTRLLDMETGPESLLEISNRAPHGDMVMHRTSSSPGNPRYSVASAPVASSSGVSSAPTSTFVSGERPKWM